MSFMKKVAKIAAPFASLIPGVGPFVSLGLGALGSIGGSGGSKSGTAGGGAAGGQQNPMQQQLMGSIQTQQNMSQGLINQGTPLINQGASATGGGLDYFKQLLSGKSNQALAGPISDLRNASNNALQNVSTFAPRGNTAASFVDRTNQVGQGIARLRSEGQTTGAQGMLQGGGQLLNAGSNLATGGLSQFSNSLSTLLGARGQDINQDLITKQMSSSNMTGLGQGIGNLLGILLSPGGLLNKPKGTGSSGGIGGIFGGIKL